MSSPEMLKMFLSLSIRVTHLEIALATDPTEIRSLEAYLNDLRRLLDEPEPAAETRAVGSWPCDHSGGVN